MGRKTLRPSVKFALEYGPLLGFLGAYIVLRNQTFTIAGTDYSGFLVALACALPAFLASIILLRILTGQTARLQIVTTFALVLFGVTSLVFNDPRIFKMKPTAIYLSLAVFLTVGLWRGRSWLRYIMEGFIPLSKTGWMTLTKRVTVLFYGSAVANELVWRSQSEGVWLFFETIVMPIVVILFFVMQIGLFIEHAAMPQGKKNRKTRR